MELEETHLKWMRKAMEMVKCIFLALWPTAYCSQAEEALAASEVPVGCVFVRDDKIIAQARNRTNELRNASWYSLARSERLPSFWPDIRRQDMQNLKLSTRSSPTQYSPQRSPNILFPQRHCMSQWSRVSCVHRHWDKWVSKPFISDARTIALAVVVVYWVSTKSISSLAAPHYGNMWKDAYGTDLTFSARLPHPKHAPYEATSGYLREEAIMVLRRFYITENTNGNF